MTNIIKELCGRHGKYTVKEIAEVLGVSNRAVYKMRSNGRLPYTDLSGKTEHWKKINNFDKQFTRKKLLGK